MSNDTGPGGRTVDRDGLRQRARPPSLVNGQQYPSPSPGPSLRRTSSLLSDSSLDSRRQSLRSPTEEFLLPKAPATQDEMHQEPSLWYSLPLLFAVLPAIGGVTFKQGSIFITDLTLLIMAAIYLNWLLITPWVWYHSAQTIKIAKPSIIEAIDEESADEEDSTSSIGHSSTKDIKENDKTSSKKEHPEQQTSSTAETAALRELQLHELFALLMCFAGPLIGAYILHIIRTQVHRFGDELVSNLHLTLFVFGAELRPMRHCMKLFQARTLHLQRLVRQDPHAVDQIDTALVQELMERVNAAESSISEVATKSLTTVDTTTSITSETVKKAQSVLQTQVDALNRAVRRYEKRATAQTIQNEARLQDLESRLRDALSLAAAAANYSQTPGLVHTAFEWAKSLLLLPLKAVSSMMQWPLQLVGGALTTVLVRLGLARPAKRRRQPAKPLSYSRMNNNDIQLERTVKK